MRNRYEFQIGDMVRHFDKRKTAEVISYGSRSDHVVVRWETEKVEESSHDEEVSVYQLSFVGPPKVGEGGTVHYISDSEPVTIISVGPNKKTVVVQEDSSKIISGNVMEGSAEYEHFRNVEGRTWTFTLRKGGIWVEKGGSVRNGLKLSLGERNKYRDPHF